MEMNKAAHAGLTTNFRFIYTQEFDASTPEVAPFVDEYTSTNAKEDMAWISGIPTMREWIGDRQPRDVVDSSFSVTFRKYEASIKVKADDIRDDNVGKYTPLIRGLAREAAHHMDRLVADLIDAAGTTLCYDGQPLVDDSHPAYGGFAAFDNKGTTALTADATGAAAISAGKIAMSSYKDDKGRKLGLKATHLVVPAELEDIARALVESPYKIDAVTTNTPNPNRNLKVIVLPLLGDATNWYLVDSNAVVKPVIRIVRKAPVFTAADNPSDVDIFMKDEWYYGVDSRLAVVPGFPQAIYGSIVAG